jgi:hypothetical protein
VEEFAAVVAKDHEAEEQAKGGSGEGQAQRCRARIRGAAAIGSLEAKWRKP